MPDLPKSLLDAVIYFRDVENCRALIRRVKWPDGKPACPHCGSVRIVDRTDDKLRCKDCRKTTSDKKYTIFEDSPIPLWKWFVCVWQVVSSKNGVSSYEMARALEVAQKTAWFIDHRIRQALGVVGRPNYDGVSRPKTTWDPRMATKKPKKPAGYGNFMQALKKLVPPVERPKQEKSPRPKNGRSLCAANARAAFRFSQPKITNPTKAIAKLRKAGLKAWDNIPDPLAYLERLGS